MMLCRTEFKPGFIPFPQSAPYFHYDRLLVTALVFKTHGLEVGGMSFTLCHLFLDDSLEKSLMLGKIEGRWRRGHQRMRWLDNMNLANSRR